MRGFAFGPWVSDAKSVVSSNTKSVVNSNAKTASLEGFVTTFLHNLNYNVVTKPSGGWTTSV